MQIPTCRMPDVHERTKHFGHHIAVSGRYQYDPNPRVRDGMTNIWRVLVDEPRKTVDQHFDAILRELLREMGGKLWRNRESAALAIADLLQVRHHSIAAARVKCCLSVNLHGRYCEVFGQGRLGRVAVYLHCPTTHARCIGGEIWGNTAE